MKQQLLRTKRLLLIAQSPNCWHKRWYSQYLPLIYDGYVYWTLGTAFLTVKGKRYLEELQNVQDSN